MNAQDLTQTLVESFNTLADEVQNLNDRQVMLEHKLRYAHEQYQYLADKYAPAAPEISETLAHLQMPPELNNPSLANTNFVPLPKRKSVDSKHQIALIIREGRRVASSLTDPSKSSHSSRGTLSRTTLSTVISTILEQDFTVEGKKGTLGCPFSVPSAEDEEVDGVDQTPKADETPHRSTDPICAAMYEETTSQPAPSAQGGASKCPIRYMDSHSPEEIAHYLETHKHELPRSHELCLRRYQKNEDHIRKIDAKYGNLVSMVEGLSRIHQPMLPEQDTRPQSEVEGGSKDRVESWAQTVSATVPADVDATASEGEEDSEDRQSHFDRPLKEVRVGESPSRPWGISVPVNIPAMNDGGHGRPASPPPAPVHMPSSTPGKRTGKCPFDHAGLQVKESTPLVAHAEERTPGNPRAVPSSRLSAYSTTGDPPPAAGLRQPAFLNAADLAQSSKNQTPQMVFTGPVFIGYPMEQAIQFMQHLQGQQGQQQFGA